MILKCIIITYNRICDTQIFSDFNWTFKFKRESESILYSTNSEGHKELIYSSRACLIIFSKPQLVHNFVILMLIHVAKLVYFSRTTGFSSGTFDFVVCVCC